VLGIGERVGITSLGGLVACLYAADPEYVKSKYNLPMLREIENLVAEAVEVTIPFMNPITYVRSRSLATHDAYLSHYFVQRLLRIHAQGRYPRQGDPEQPRDLRDPQARGFRSQALRLHRVRLPFSLLPSSPPIPSLTGTRHPRSHRLTGWNAVKSRVEQLGLQMTDDQVKDATAKIKELADVRTQSMEDVDTVLRVYHSGVVSGELELGDKQMFDRLLQRHRESSIAPAPEDSLSSTSTQPNANGVPVAV